MNELCLLSASRLAKMIREGQVSSFEVVEAHVKRAQDVNPKLNAVIADRYQAALEEARAFDNAGRRETAGRFGGVPFSVKECIDLEGAPNTQGSIHRRDSRATSDATTVKRMRQAGAIPIGTTNIPEWAFWFECDNPIHGRSNNPYDLNRTPGGSSGGEAALIAAGGSPMGLGSDVGGSIRMPAGFCGIYGHKPTNRVIPLTGHYPVYAANAHEFAAGAYPYTTQGPMCRKAEDLWPMMKTLSGPDGLDPETGKTGMVERALAAPEGLSDPRSFWKGKRVFILPEPRFFLAGRLDEANRLAVTRSADVFADLGSRIEPFEETMFKKGFEIWSACMGAVEGPTAREEFGGGTPPNLILETWNLIRGKRRYTWPTLATCFMEMVALGAIDKVKLMAARDALLAEFESRLDEDGILLLPVHPRLAPRHNSTFSRPIDFVYTAIFNVLEVPATVAPVLMSSEGVPAGVQIVGRRGADRLTIAAAEALETAGLAWTPPQNL